MSASVELLKGALDVNLAEGTPLVAAVTSTHPVSGMSMGTSRDQVRAVSSSMASAAHTRGHKRPPMAAAPAPLQPHKENIPVGATVPPAGGVPVAEGAPVRVKIDGEHELVIYVQTAKA